MARSIHETRHQLEEVLRWDLADDRRREEELWIVRHRLGKKRRYKERSKTAPRLAPPERALPHELAVSVEEVHPFVHHPLSAEDVRGLLDTMSADIRADVSAIRLRTGAREDDMAGEGTEPDPWTGRPAHRLGEVIWCPRLLGRFRIEPAEIDLFGYAYDPAQLRAAEVQLTLLWLMQAHTLAHETAHCWDAVARSSGDRWALDEKSRAEDYAERMADEWLTRDAIRYFRRHHPDQAHTCEQWLRTHIGVPITLERIAADMDRSIWGAVVGLWEITGTWSPETEIDARVTLAEQFHFVDDFVLARQILEPLAEQHSGHVQASVLLGDIAVHERDWPRALELTARSLELAPDDLDALEDRVDALIGARQWEEATAVCDRAIAAADTAADDWRRFGVVLDRARCHLESGRYPDALRDLDDIDAAGHKGRSHRAAALRVEVFSRQQDWLSAVAEADRALVLNPYAPQRTYLVAARWEALRHLGQDDPRPAPTERQLSQLRWNGRDAWVDRLLALGLQPEPERRTRRQADLNARRGPLMRL